MSTEHVVKDTKDTSQRQEHAATSEEQFQSESPAITLDLTPDNILRLQKIIGNTATTRLLIQRQSQQAHIRWNPARLRPQINSLNPDLGALIANNRFNFVPTPTGITRVLPDGQGGSETHQWNIAISMRGTGTGAP